MNLTQIGVIVAVLNVSWILYREWRTRRRIRTMICVEIEDNLQRLRDFQAKAHKASTFTNNPTLSTVQQNDALRSNTWPSPISSFWRSLAGSVSTALSSKQVTDVYRFHAQLVEMATIKSDTEPSVHAARIQAELAQVIEIGNPLRVCPRGDQPRRAS